MEDMAICSPVSYLCCNVCQVKEVLGGIPADEVLFSGVAAVVVGYFFLVETRPPSLAHGDVDPEKRPVPASWSDTMKVPNFALFTFVFCCK